MGNLFKIAIRNLLRYKRRTLLTASLITIGVVFVLVFISVSGSFKNMMIGQITDSYMGHLQVHRKGYVASIDNLPLNLNLKASTIARLENILDKQPEIEAYSPRIKFGGMFSNFVETTNIRLVAVYPDREFRTVPLLPLRITSGGKTLNRGEILIPDLLAKGMKVNIGDMVVIVATNVDGSVNGKQFKVAGIVEGITGPGGRDGYIHIEDAAELLRMEKMEISEFAIRLKDFGKLGKFSEKLDGLLSKELNQQNKPIFELHTWEKLSPFFNIAKMIDVMTFFIKLMLIAIVLISIMNVMIMAVYERIREIGTIAAIGTLPSRILNMFVIEGFCLGIAGTIIGNIAGIVIIFTLNMMKMTYNFGQQKGLILQANINPADILVISVTVIIVSVLASLQPAFKASRMEPIKALRHI
ncbi:MAG TPA: ABC transporter substrate-binding protein [Nitrospiraceae bacterium]|nr:MAG: ABC transporter substrate-binding protein [Nitrospirae bacterium GWA2_46_11]OGW24330.1 MAG: ABC transporter substrate-binding protein [Nitrospirae bacterium GWB2_47_37]HAK88427.1 ABC transporter substrate-binding protein [Nitrospiraceae bacterium]HCZ11980.1 ABC transporter substrate-binding protein [Nitrospiraceae bacterium]